MASFKERNRSKMAFSVDSVLNNFVDGEVLYPSLKVLITICLRSKWVKGRSTTDIRRFEASFTGTRKSRVLLPSLEEITIGL
ncbi:hypothetical protein BPAE_0056g00440 [Botrytis paeoniae]|uniref:Uncharacterized protein n=1 Tax=Botrytis paeoniae TaxID=278948 RepID=A0A4Z1FUG0_9HELO|nr:hypothetical protein BPAE_0056g00440 [Botrytis paeoniae]